MKKKLKVLEKWILVLKLFTTVVGSFDINLKEPESFSDKIRSSLGLYDPYKLAIEETVKLQLKTGIDIVADGQVRGDMVGSFVRHIPGFSYEQNSSVIVGMIKQPMVDITVSDIKFAMSVLKKEIDNYGFSEEEKAKKGVKGIITGPSTIVHSSRIESFYKDRNSAIIATAHALRREMEAIDKSGAKYIQIDEPFLSTGMVDLKTASEAIAILSEGIEIPVAMHVCGNLNDVFKDLTKFPIDYLDCEFAGNNVNIGILEENADLLKGKKLGFGCLDSASNSVDEAKEVKSLVERGIALMGKDNIFLDPDCGLRKVDIPIAENKLKIMTDLAKEFE